MFVPRFAVAFVFHYLCVLFVFVLEVISVGILIFLLIFVAFFHSFVLVCLIPCSFLSDFLRALIHSCTSFFSCIWKNIPITYTNTKIYQLYGWGEEAKNQWSKKF